MHLQTHSTQHALFRRQQQGHQVAGSAPQRQGRGKIAVLGGVSSRDSWRVDNCCYCPVIQTFSCFSPTSLKQSSYPHDPKSMSSRASLSRCCSNALLGSLPPRGNNEKAGNPDVQIKSLPPRMAPVFSQLPFLPGNRDCELTLRWAC